MVRLLALGLPRIARLETDRHGILTHMSALTPPDVGNPVVGRPYWYPGQQPNLWLVRGIERYDRTLAELRAAPGPRIHYDRHEIFQTDGTLALHVGVTTPRRHGGGFERWCYLLPTGPRSLRRLLAQHLAPLMESLGEGFLGCAVDSTGLCWWWPRRLAELSGIASLEALGHRPPPIYARPSRTLLPAPPHPQAPHVGVPVRIGRLSALVSALPQAGGAFYLYFLERHARLIKV